MGALIYCQPSDLCLIRLIVIHLAASNRECCLLTPTLETAYWIAVPLLTAVLYSFGGLHTTAAEWRDGVFYLQLVRPPSNCQLVQTVKVKKTCDAAVLDNANLLPRPRLQSAAWPQFA